MAEGTTIRDQPFGIVYPKMKVFIYIYILVYNIKNSFHISKIRGKKKKESLWFKDVNIDVDIRPNQFYFELTIYFNVLDCFPQNPRSNTSQPK